MCICSFSAFFEHIRLAASDYHSNLSIILEILQKKKQCFNINLFVMAMRL